MMEAKPLILITNDDGIDSPGLAALAPALEPLGDLLIVAPLAQQTSMGRSRSGENIGSCVTVSGTIGAALEAADQGVPAIAASLEYDHSGPHDDLPEIDFSVAAHFIQLFAGRMLNMAMPADVDLLKIDIPSSAYVDSRWMVTHQDRLAYYQPRVDPDRDAFAGENIFIHWPQKRQYIEHGSDAHALAHGIVSVTPLSINLTSRTSLTDLSEQLRQVKASEQMFRNNL